MKFKKKPIVIEATKFMGGFSFDEMLVEWGKPFASSSHYVEISNTLTIKTLEGAMLADIGDYIIKGIKGEFYPCKPDIFEISYELVE